MASALRSLIRTAVFSSSAVPSNTSTYQRKEGAEPIHYYGYSGAPDHRAILALMIIRAMNKTPESELTYDGIEVYVMTVSELIFPGIVATIDKAEAGVPMKMLTDPILTDLSALDPTNNTDSATGGKKYSCVLASEMPFLPQYHEASPMVAAARWGVEMFVFGKNPTALNLQGFQQNRPQAVIDKYDFTAAEAFLMNGTDFKPTLPVLTRIKQFLTRNPNVRYALADYWISRLDHTGNKSLMAFNVTFRLTDSYGLNSAKLIAGLLLAFPDLDTFPQLRAEINAYYLALSVFMREQEKNRGFMKVLYGDNYSVFQSSSRGGLLALAVMHATAISPSVSNFLSSTSSYEPLRQKANEHLKAVGGPSAPVIVSRLDAAVAAVEEIRDLSLDPK